MRVFHTVLTDGLPRFSKDFDFFHDGVEALGDRRVAALQCASCYCTHAKAYTYTL